MELYIHKIYSMNIYFEIKQILEYYWSDNYSILHISLTGLVLKLVYSCIARSIPWLLMSCFLLSPGHQQPWYWLRRMNVSFSSMRKDFSCLHHMNVKEWWKMQIYIMSLQMNSAHWDLAVSTTSVKDVQTSISINTLFIFHKYIVYVGSSGTWDFRFGKWSVKNILNNERYYIGL